MFPESHVNPYEDTVEFYTREPMIHPVSRAPEPKRRFLPSKWEHEKVMKLVRAIRAVCIHTHMLHTYTILKLANSYFINPVRVVTIRTHAWPWLWLQGKIKPPPPPAPEVFMLWDDSEDVTQQYRPYDLPAPKIKLPGMRVYVRVCMCMCMCVCVHKHVFD
jgi:hypothetical protein